MLAIRDYDAAPYLLLATKRGLVKKTALPLYDSPRQAGIIAVNFRDDDDELIGAELCSATDEVLLISKKGQSIRFPADDEELRPMGRATSGVTGMKFRDGDELLSMSVIRAGSSEDRAVRVHRHRRRVREADRGRRSIASRAAAGSGSRP